MCQDYVEVHKCKHETKTPIPCEGKDNSGTCTAKPEDTQDIITESNFDCPGCQAEEAKQADDAVLAEAMKKIKEDPALAPAPKTANKPAGNFGTYKLRTRWERCGHCTDPIDTGDARQHADDDEWTDLKEPGNCDNCSLTNPNDLAEMRARGELDCDDPWGALDIKDEPETGGSANAAARPKHPASNIPDDDEDDDRGHFMPTRSPSPDQIPTITRGKGKGRASKPEETYASRHGAAEPAVPDYDSDAGHEDDSPLHSGDEDHDEGAKARKGKAPKYALEDDDEDYDDDDEEEEEEEEEPTPRGRKVKKHGVGSSSRGSSSKSGTQRNRARGDSSDYSHDEEDEIPDWSSRPPPGGPPPPMASGALRPAPRNSARRNARASEDDE